MHTNSQVPEGRELDTAEMGLVSGAGPLGASWKIGTAVGTAIYNHLSPKTQDTIGGTIATAIDNIKAGRPFG